METNVLDWLEVTAAACPDKPAFLDEDSAVTFADVRREARIIGTAAAKFRAGRKKPIAVMSGRNAHTPAVFLGAVYAGCCYAPMDGTMPVHRLNSILNTLDTDLMIVQRAFYDKAKTLDFSGTILIAEELLAGSEDAALLADCRARLMPFEIEEYDSVLLMARPARLRASSRRSTRSCATSRTTPA